MTDFKAVVQTLTEAGVDCVIVGGFAAAVHGSARLTQDVDFVYSRTPANIERLVAALKPHSPYLRGAPPGLPFDWSAETVRRGLNFTLTTAIGDVDLLGEITGGGDYERLLPHTGEVDLFGCRCLCLSSLWWNPGERRERGGARLTRRVREEYRVYCDRNATQSAAKRRGSAGMHRRSNAAWVSPQAVNLPALIRAKRAAGRPKDFEALAELEALLEERDERRNG